MPEGVEIVPSIFVTLDVLYELDEEGIRELATRIVDRVDHICLWHDISNWTELQLGCDWTESTQELFYLLCSLVRERLPKGKLLSSTIRLRQLQQPAPPVDYGVLMVYNTGNFRDQDEENSILNESAVEMYLKQCKDFTLPLDIALPIYNWNLVYGTDGRFHRITRDDYMAEDEVVKSEAVSVETIERTQKLLNDYLHLQHDHHSTILYHLDEENLNHYSDEQIKSIYSR